MEDSAVKKRGLKVIETLQPGGRVFAVVRVVEHQTDRAILKDFSRSPWLFQQSFGRFLVALEACAYRRLEGVAGVPRLIARLTPHALLLEHVAGTNCLTAGPDRFSQEFFDHAAALLSEVRRRGVLHCDVGRNLVLGDDGKPWLVDFASSVVLPRRQGRVGAFLRQLRGKYDERALLKVKRRRAPHLLRATEAEQSRSVLPFEGWVRQGERFVRRTIGWLSG
jgi:RIO-like serine/threonine protein kinase